MRDIAGNEFRFKKKITYIYIHFFSIKDKDFEEIFKQKNIVEVIELIKKT